MISQVLLDVLCCPLTKQSLTIAEQKLVDEVNQKIKDSSISSRNGLVVTELVDGLLVCEDGVWAYPIRDQIPVMLTSEALPLAK